MADTALAQSACPYCSVANPRSDDGRDISRQYLCHKNAKNSFTILSQAYRDNSLSSPSALLSLPVLQARACVLYCPPCAVASGGGHEPDHRGDADPQYR